MSNTYPGKMVSLVIKQYSIIRLLQIFYLSTFSKFLNQENELMILVVYGKSHSSGSSLFGGNPLINNGNSVNKLIEKFQNSQ